MVLLVHRPLRPQVVDEDQPVAGQREEMEEGRSQLEDRGSEVEEGPVRQRDDGTTGYWTKAEKP